MKASETFLFAETWQFIWAWGLHSEPDILVIFFKIKKATDKPGSVLDSTEIQLLNRTIYIVGRLKNVVTRVLQSLSHFRSRTLYCANAWRHILLFWFLAQLNFSGPWENISTFWQYLLLQLNKTLPNLTLPYQFSIPFPNLAGGTHPSPARGHLTPAPNPDYF